MPKNVLAAGSAELLSEGREPFQGIEMDSTSISHRSELGAADSDRSPKSASRCSEATADEFASRETAHELSEPAADHSPEPSSRQILSDAYAPIRGALAEVERRLVAELDSPHASIAPLLRHGTQLGGKRLRPAMLLLAAEATGAIQEEHLVLATVVEMVHTATLVHDDVLDDAEFRRHVPTVNARWDKATSILLGDYLFSQAFRLAASLPTTKACQIIGEASRRVCEGELRQVMSRNVVELDEPTYLAVIRSKTADLCRAACQLGALYSGADETNVQRLANFGDAIGIAFQIADDYLDLWGDERVGKTLGTDLAQGKMTLPLIRLVDKANPSERRLFLEILGGPADQRARIRAYLQQSDARVYTQSRAHEFRQRAVDELAALADSAARRSLISLANFSVDRRF